MDAACNATDTELDVGLAYVEFYVADAESQAELLVDRYAFRIVARHLPVAADHRSVAVRQGDILLILTEGRHESHPASVYVAQHGDGVANIGLATADVHAAYAEAVARGAVPVMAPSRVEGRTTAAIRAFGDVIHTFEQREEGARGGWSRAGWSPVADQGGERLGLRRVDHFAVCVAAGGLDPLVDHYVAALGFRAIFEEVIIVGTQAMNSKVVQSASGELTFTIIEPDPARDAGQIDEFLAQHGGAGVQHVAFSAPDIVRAVGALRGRGVEFLSTPAAYYDRLARRVPAAYHDVRDLRDLDILVDVDHGGHLFQIFTRSVHPRRTFFFEIIERQGARTFGSGNIKALYEAVEAERIQTRDVVW